jgi:FAD:protein FMN transferase
MIRNALITVIVLILAGCSVIRPSSIRRTELVFSTPCTVTIFDRGGERAVEAVFEEMRRIESIMNVYDPASEIAMLNKHAGGDPLTISDELYRVVQTGIAFGQVTGGAFDISIGPLVSLWNIGGENPRVPTEDEINEALDLVEYLDILLLDYQNQALLKREGMSVDLGGIAKGYAADRAAEVLAEHSIDRAIIDFGGNIYVLGEKDSESPWRIGIQNPEEPRGNFLGILSVRDTAAVTSGVYERFFEFEGETYHHILDPETGHPVTNGLSSVTIVSTSAMTADALSTAVFVLGIPSGITLVENFEGVEALLVTESRGIYMTSGVESMFSLSDDRFGIVRGDENE